MRDSPASPPPLSWGTKLLYALGAAVTAIEGRAISAFLMIYYNQVMGLSPAVVAAAISVTLLFDAVCDPLVGQISDNFRSRWGRRHLFMYASAAPVALAFYLLWAPPAGWSDNAILGWMLACLLVIRLFDTFFELPSAALLPELTRDYSERTVLFTARSLFSISGGVLMTIAAYQVFMKEAPDGTGGILAREGYAEFGLVFALVLAAIIIVSSLGTHSRIPYLAKPPARRLSGKVAGREILQTLRNPAFWVIAVAGTFAYASGGLRFAMELYFGLYFWELSQTQMAMMSVGIAAGIWLGAPITPLITRRFGKKNGYFILVTCSILLGALPFVLRLTGLAPPNGSQALFWLLFIDGAVYNVFFIGCGITMSSMLSDVVEDAEVKTGRRSEGLLLAADNLIRKSVSGLGPLLTALVLSVSMFPRGAERGTVPAEVLHNMVLVYLPLVTLLMLAAAGVVSLFRIDEARHRANLGILRDRALSGADEPAP